VQAVIGHSIGGTCHEVDFGMSAAQAAAGSPCRSEEYSRDVRRVGASLVLAGGAACAYHSTEPSGKRIWLRSVFRKLDHWTVSLASAALVCAAGPEVCCHVQRDP
jgi:hypothetical protein